MTDTPTTSETTDAWATKTLAPDPVYVASSLGQAARMMSDTPGALQAGHLLTKILDAPWTIASFVDQDMTDEATVVARHATAAVYHLTHGDRDPDDTSRGDQALAALRGLAAEIHDLSNQDTWHAVTNILADLDLLDS